MVLLIKQTNRQGVDAYGMEECRPLILNAMREAVAISTTYKRRLDMWKELMPKMNVWRCRLQIDNRYREDRPIYNKEIKQIKSLSWLLDSHKKGIQYNTVDIEQLKENVSMIDLVASYGVKLQRNNNHFKAKCIDHEEKTASMHVWEDHTHCFGCQKHHDIISFVQEQEQCDFKSALNLLTN